MSTMKVEHTADGRELVYRVYVHPEVFNWHDIDELMDILTMQFRSNLEEGLREIQESFE
jgi:hypothetical protein